MRTLALTACLVLTPAAFGQPIGEIARRNGWLTDYAAARAEARRTGKPLMVVFRCEP